MSNWNGVGWCAQVKDTRKPIDLSKLTGRNQLADIIKRSKKPFNMLSDEWEAAKKWAGNPHQPIPVAARRFFPTNYGV